MESPPTSYYSLSLNDDEVTKDNDFMNGQLSVEDFFEVTPISSVLD